jgi:flagellar basal body-associated protein FliL
MMKFFRNIRQKLAYEHKFSAYLRYAVGEIILVVIGILIALRVNNWNEQRKSSQRVNNALAEIHDDLALDRTVMQDHIAVLKGDLTAQENVITTLEQKRAFTGQTYRDLGRVMLMRRIELNNNGYGLLKELGISHIKDPVLRNALVDYYGTKTHELVNDIKDNQHEFETPWLGYVRKNFKVFVFGKRAVPNDDHQIRNSSYFLMMMKMNLDNRGYTLREEINTLQADSTLSELIDSKLNP